MVSDGDVPVLPIGAVSRYGKLDAQSAFVTGGAGDCEPDGSETTSFLQLEFWPRTIDETNCKRIMQQ